METVNEILNFTFSNAALQEAGTNSIPPSLHRLHEVRIEKLMKITVEVGEAPFKFTGETHIPNVFKKFKKIIRAGELHWENFDRRELRTLTYSLSYSEQNISQIFGNPSELDFALETLERGWRDSFLIGLVDCYLQNWESKHTVSIEKLNRFIFNKLRNYEGNRTVLKSLKLNMRFFDSRNGDILLGSELAIKKSQLKQATKFLSLPDSWFSYPYFSKVILAYYLKRKEEIQKFLYDLSIALHEHNNSISSKRLVSKLIIQANTMEFATLQDKIKGIAFNTVGDPGNAANWTAFPNATDNEREELKRARGLLNEWITRQFINVFFERCINDSRRKRFWLKYAKEITQFRVVGSVYIKNILIADSRISDYVVPRFSRTNSTTDRNAALMFVMKNHLFIEFSDEGAFYAYKLSNVKAPSIEEPFFFSTSSLKTPSMPWLVYRTGNSVNKIYDEGRLGHNDGELGWEDIAKYWIEKKVLLNV
ncbi:MAG: EH signature domain-containing protein [Chitinophagales bacterium]